MRNGVGLWIDHKKAVIVSISEKGETVRTIESNIEKHVRFRGGARAKTPFGAQFFTAETQLDRQYNEHLNKFYAQVISAIEGADFLLLFGCGEAKLEFKRRMAHEKCAIKEIQIETADKMTDRQIKAKVRKYFQQ